MKTIIPRARLGRLPTTRHNARSEASEHALALVAIPRQDPTTLTNALRRPFRCTTRARRPFHKGASEGCFDCAYGFAQHDIIYERHFLGASANEKTATGDKLSLSPLAVDVNVCSCKIRVSKTCAYLCACKHTCAVVCNKCSSHCSSPQSIARQYKRIVLVTLYLLI